MVRRIAGPGHTVEVLDMRRPEVAARATQLGVQCVPSVVVDGQLAENCASRGLYEGILAEAIHGE
jgi:predicted DsbA family dithiol-disulfide isomerase